jgi:hypothetical protein
MGDIEIRMTKMEGFAGSIESKINSKMEVTKSMGDRLEVFVIISANIEQIILRKS